MAFVYDHIKFCYSFSSFSSGLYCLQSPGIHGTTSSTTLASGSQTCSFCSLISGTTPMFGLDGEGFTS
jgi:hypothetical protein